MSNSKLLMAASAAVSLLGAAGAAHATVVGTDNVTVSTAGVLGTTTITSASGAGAGVLDDSGTLTINYSSTGQLFGSAITTTSTDVIDGTLANGVFTANGSGSTTLDTCTGSSFCKSGLGTTPFATLTGSISLTAGGTFSGTALADGGAETTTLNYTVGATSGTSPPPPPPVPLPPAVWLLGSGLLGLVGTARRRSIAAGRS